MLKALCLNLKFPKDIHDFECFLNWKTWIKIEDAENRLNNGTVQQIQNIDHFPGSANQNKVGQNDHCLTDDGGIRPVCETNEDVYNMKGKVKLELEERKSDQEAGHPVLVTSEVSGLCQETGNLH